MRDIGKPYGRRIGAVVVVVGALLAIAGCGGSDEMGARGGTSDADNRINIMAIDAFAIPETGSKNFEDTAALARAAAVNAAGGVNGRPFNVITCNTQADTNRAADCARQAVDKKVSAVVGLTAGGGGPAIAILEKARIPVFGNSTSSKEASLSPVSFAIASDPSLFSSGVPLFNQIGVKKMGVIIPEFSLGDSTEEQNRIDASLIKPEMKIGNVVQVPLTTTDFSPFAAKALADGAEGVFVFYPGPSVVTILKSLNQINPEAKLATINLLLQKEELEQLGPLAEDLLVSGVIRPPSARTRGIKLFEADVKRYYPETPVTDGPVTLWTSVWVLERIMKELETVNNETVLKKLGTLENFDLGGLYPPMTTTKDGPNGRFPRAFNASVTLNQYKDGELIELLPPDKPFYDPNAAAAEEFEKPL